jgi:ribosome-binding protein aMBF1 (putative translation factor)
MTQTKTVTEWMAEKNLSLADLIAAAPLERRVVDAIVHGRYTPSPQQRQSLATALGVSLDEIAWGHVTAVEHIHGHGPQFGRSP